MVGMRSGWRVAQVVSHMHVDLSRRLCAAPY